MAQYPTSPPSCPIGKEPAPRYLPPPASPSLHSLASSRLLDTPYKNVVSIGSEKAQITKYIVTRSFSPCKWALDVNVDRWPTLRRTCLSLERWFGSTGSHLASPVPVNRQPIPAIGPPIPSPPQLRSAPKWSAGSPYPSASRPALRRAPLSQFHAGNFTCPRLNSIPPSA